MSHLGRKKCREMKLSTFQWGSGESQGSQPSSTHVMGSENSGHVSLSKHATGHAHMHIAGQEGGEPLHLLNKSSLHVFSIVFEIALMIFHAHYLLSYTR